MKLYLKQFFLTLFLFSFWNCFSQQFSQKDRIRIDSLKNLSYKDIYASFLEVDSDSSKAFVFAQAYLEKGKEEKDTIRIANAYSQFSYISDPKIAIIYADSIIVLTKEINSRKIMDITYPGDGYFIRALYLYDIGEYKKALLDLLEANKYAREYEDYGRSISITTTMANLKSILGDYEGALILHKKCLEFFQKESNKIGYGNYDNNREYNAALNNISLDYINLGKLDSADIYIKEGIKKSLKTKDNFNYYQFISTSGYNEYFKGNYQAAIDSLDKAFPYDDDQNSRINHYLYTGKIAKDLGNKEKAILNFEKLDSIYEIHQDPVRELPEVYQTFIDFYKEKGEVQNQLKYIDKLIAADSVLDANFNYLNTKITKEYDIPILLSEKEQLIKRLKSEKRISNTGLGVLGGISLLLAGFLYYYFRKQKLYKKRFEEILNSKPNSKSQILNSKSQILNSKPQSLKLKGISKEVINQIKERLQAFEKEKEFLYASITLNSLSKKLDTNSNYLSKVINSYEQKNFSTYINDLRIEYAIEQLKTNAQFRLYSVKGMAEEIGFNSPLSFSKAFHKRTGLYPSYFLKQLEKVLE